MKKLLRKKLCVFLIASLLVIMMPTQSVHSWNYEDMFVDGSILYDLLSDFDRPDDPIMGDDANTPYDECVAIAEDFEVDYHEELEDFFGQMNYGVDEGIDEFCDIMTEVPRYIDDAMNEAGLFFETSGTTDFTDFGETSDWKNIENLTFDHPMGTIVFDQPVNFFSYDFIMLALSFQTAFYIEQGIIYLDSDLVRGLKEIGARIILKNLPDYEEIKILVDGKEDVDGIATNIVYDRENHTVTFDALHFTYFMVVDVDYVVDLEDSEDNEKAHIDSWKAQKYQDLTKSQNIKVKLEIKGKHFSKDAEVRIGGKKADRIKKISSKKLLAWFDYDELMQKYDPNRNITVKNPDAKKAKAKKEIDLRKINWKIDPLDFNLETSEGIKNIQKALFNLEYLSEENIVGTYGPLTIQAVKKFQADNGLPQTGFVGPLTIKKIQEKL